MFPKQLQKILELIKRTRDRVVIFDASAPDDSYVVMDFDNYSDLAGKGQDSPVPAPAGPVPTAPATPSASPDLSTNLSPAGNLTEEDLTDKINREISMWKNGESSSYLAEEAKPRPAWRIPPSVKDKAQEVKE